MSALEPFTAAWILMSDELPRSQCRALIRRAVPGKADWVGLAVWSAADNELRGWWDGAWHYKPSLVYAYLPISDLSAPEWSVALQASGGEK